MPTSWEQQWTSPAWRHEVVAWVDAALAAQGLTRTGEPEQVRMRMWATGLTVPTDGGLFWLKDNCPGQRAEAAVVEALAEIAPDHVVAPLAVDPDRGWMLSADQGTTLAEVGDTDLDTWLTVAAAYADLQRRTVPFAERLRAAGLHSVHPARAASYVEQQVARLRALPAGHPRRIDRDLATRLGRCLPRLAEIGAALAAGPVPMTLEHNDLHHHNAFAPQPGARTLRFFDFGDAVWAHPFSSLSVLRSAIGDEWGVGPDHPRVAPVVDAYLQCWTDAAPKDDLDALVPDAHVLSRLHRYVSWDRCLDGVDPEEMGEHGSNPARWLEELAHAVEAGG